MIFLRFHISIRMHKNCLFLPELIGWRTRIIAMGARMLKPHANHFVKEKHSKETENCGYEKYVFAFAT